MGMRTAGTPLGKFHLVYPNGKIQTLSYARNISHPCLEYSTGVRSAYNPRTGKIEQVKLDEGEEGVIARLRAEWHEAHFRDLKVLYAEDSRPAIKQHGHREYLKYEWASSHGKVERKPHPQGKTRPDGSVQMVIPPFPENLLPEGVIAAREGRAAYSDELKSYEAPSLEMLEDRVKGSNDPEPVSEVFDG